MENRDELVAELAANLKVARQIIVLQYNLSGSPHADEIEQSPLIKDIDEVLAKAVRA